MSKATHERVEVDAAGRAMDGLYHLKALGWLCPKCDEPSGPRRIIPADATPDQMMSCTIVCKRRGHHIKGEE